MPEVCRFLGIVISMYYKDHAPPHFHAKYGGERAAFSINELRLIEGSLHKRVVSLILEWAFEHRSELIEDWELAKRKEDLKKIDPLVASRTKVRFDANDNLCTEKFQAMPKDGFHQLFNNLLNHLHLL